MAQEALVCRPWSEFFERFEPPQHLQERLSANLEYYKGNYFLVFGMIAVLGLFTALSNTIIAILLGGTAFVIVYFFQDQQVTSTSVGTALIIGGHEPS
jgi:hypothetical protein